jgi:hypothetical protein
VKSQTHTFQPRQRFRRVFQKVVSLLPVSPRFNLWGSKLAGIFLVVERAVVDLSLLLVLRSTRSERADSNTSGSSQLRQFFEDENTKPMLSSAYTSRQTASASPHNNDVVRGVVGDHQ